MTYRSSRSSSQIGNDNEKTCVSNHRVTSLNIQNVDEQKTDVSVNQGQSVSSNKFRFFYPRNSIDAYNPPANDELPDLPKGPIFSLCVGYVATGFKHTERTPAQIALVDEWGNIVRNIYIKPEKPVVSYLTPITCIYEQTIAKYGFQLQKSIDILKEALSADAVLVGHYPAPDIEVLGLKKGKHYRTILDLNKL